MYAIIETGSKQYKVAQGDKIHVEKLGSDPGAQVVFDRVLLIQDGAATKVGRPVLSGASVTGTVVEDVRGDKIVVFKKRRRKDSKKKQGHRQTMSVVEITAINA